MAKLDPIGVRLEADEKAALERAAAQMERPVAWVARKGLAEWLRNTGWLKSPVASPKTPKKAVKR